MHQYNQTLHKRSLARKRMILRMLKSGKSGLAIAKKLGITHQRVYALAAAAKRKPDMATCGYCSYEESDGSLIAQCKKCKAADKRKRSNAPADAPPAGGPDQTRS